MPTGIYKHKPLSAKTKLRMSISKRGEKHPMFGKQHSKESILKMSKSHLGYKETTEHKQKISQSLKGKEPKNLEFLHQFNKGINHGNWKGDGVNYSSLHTWVTRWKEKPKVCESCKTSSEVKRLVWANKDHTYKRNLDDYISLCYKCHYHYDRRGYVTQKI